MEKESDFTIKILQMLPRAAAKEVGKRGGKVEDAKGKLARRASEIIRKRLENKNEIAQEKREAKEWAIKTKGEPAQRAQAFDWLDKNFYEEHKFAEANSLLEDAKLILKERGLNLPSWLKGQEIKYSSEVAEFAARISLLPQDLQEDPSYLYRETARLWQSVNWADDTLEGRAAQQEVREVLTRAKNKIVELDQTLFNKEQLDEVLPETRTEAVKAKRAGVFKPEDFYGESIEELPGEAKARYEELAKFLSETPNDEYTYARGVQWAAQIRRDLGRVPPEQESKLARIETVLDRKFEQLRERVSSIYLAKLEEERMEKSPVGAIERLFNDLEQAFMQNPESPLAHHYLTRLRLHMDYFLSDTYDIRRANIILESGERLNYGKLLEIRNRIGPEKKKYFEMYTKRINLVTFYESWMKAPTLQDPDFQKFINKQLREADFWGADGLFGGLVGDATRLFKQLYKAKKWDEQGNLRFLAPKDWESAKQDLISLMKDNPVHRLKYEEYLQSFPSLKEAPGIKKGERIAPDFDTAVNNVVNLASIRVVLWGEQAAINLQGATPLADNLYGGEGDKRATFLLKPKIEKLFQTWYRHVAQWGAQRGATAFERAFAYHEGKIFARAFPEVKQWAGELTDQFWKEIERSRPVIESSLKGKLDWSDDGKLSPQEKTAKKLLNKLQYVYFFNRTPDKIQVSTGDQRYQTLEKFALHIAGLKGESGKKKLLDQMTAYCGIQLADSHGLRPYQLLESGWRRSEIGSNLNVVYKQYLEEYLIGIFRSQGPQGSNGLSEEESKKLFTAFTDRELKRLFTARRVLDGANRYYDFKLWGDPLEERVRFTKELFDVARFRPHDLAEVLKERDHRGFDEWFSKWSPPETGPFKHAGEMFTAMGLRVTAINRELLFHKGLPLDFSLKYDELIGKLPREHKELVFKVLDNLAVRDGITREQFFTGMRELSRFLRGNEDLNIDQKWEKGDLDKVGAVKDLLDIRYEPLLKNRIWDDDLPMDLMDDADRLKELKITGKDGRELKGFHMDVSSAVGESHGPGKRFIRDLAGAEAGFDKLPFIFVTDTKLLFKTIGEIRDIINTYNGDKNAGYFTLSKGEAWMAMSRVYPELGPLFKSRPDSSDIDKYAKGKSLDIEELRHGMEELFRTISINVPNSTPILKPFYWAADAYNGISNWIDVVGGENGWARQMVRNFVRLMEKTGARLDEEDVFADLIDRMNERLPSGISAMKGGMAALFIVGFLIVYSLTETQKAGKSQGKE